MNTIQLLEDDVLWCLRRLPKHLRDYMKDVKPGKVFLAGGFLRACIANETVSDIDLFTPDHDAASAGALSMAARMGRPGFPAKIHESKYAFTVVSKPYPIQFIHKWVFEKPEDAILSFDYSIAQAAIWFDPAKNAWASCASDRFYPDLAAKRLHYLSPDRIEEAGGSMLRLLKFYQKGYRVPLDSLGAIIARLAKGMDMDRVKAVALGSGITEETQMARVLTGLLREVDPATGFHVAYFAERKQGDEAATDAPAFPEED